MGFFLSNAKEIISRRPEEELNFIRAIFVSLSLAAFGKAPNPFSTEKLTWF